MQRSVFLGNNGKQQISQADACNRLGHRSIL